MKPLGDSHLIERGNSLKNNNIFLRIKQFIQKNKCNLCKKTIFLYKIAVALRMECVDLSIHFMQWDNVSRSHSVWSAWI